MTTAGFEIAIVLLLVLANGVLAMSEMALVTVRAARLKQRADAGDAGSQAALKLLEEPSRFLSTVQVGITLVAIVLGVFGGATIAEDLSGPLASIPPVAPYAEAVAFVLVIVLITYVSLVLGEIVPKRMALSDPERISSLVSRPVKVLSLIAAPAVRILSFSTETVARLVGVPQPGESAATEEEIRILIEQATNAGVFDPVEQELVEKVFRLGDRRVNSLMTPRPRILWINVEDPLERSRREMSESGNSNFPVCEGNLDKVLGIVSIKNLWLQTSDGDEPDLRAALHPAPLVPENMPAFKVLEVFRESGSRVALVIDEYGSTQGIVTPIDVLEAIVGDVSLSNEPAEPRAIRRDDGSWLFDGALSADVLRDTFELRRLPEEERGNYQTVGGFMMMHMRRIPREGECFEWGGLRFEVADMDGNRVNKVLVMPVQDETGDDSVSR